MFYFCELYHEIIKQAFWSFQLCWFVS